MAKKKPYLEDEPKEIISMSDELEKGKPYMAKFQKARNFNNSRQDAYAELMAFYQGNQHLLKKYKEVKPWVINMNTPYASVAIDNRVSSLLANDYIGDILPLAPEDTETVAKLDTVYKREWKRLNIDRLVDDSISGAAVVREFYLHLYYDKDKIYGGSKSKREGILCASTIEPAAIYIDPEARKLKDARYMFVMGRISKEEALEKYPKLATLHAGGDSFTPADRGEVYVDNDYTSEQSDVLTTLTYYGKTKGKIERVKMIAGIIVEEPKMMPLKKGFPIAQFRWKRAAQSCYGLSLMDEVLSLQKAINSIQSAITNTALAYAAPSMVVRKGCGIDPKVVAKSSGAPGVVYHVDGDPNNALQPVIPPKIDNNILNIQNEYIMAVNNITGVSNQFLGDIGSAGNTSGGSKIAVERAKIIEIDVLKNIEEYVHDIVEILIDFITNIYEGDVLSYRKDNKNLAGEYEFETVELPSEEVLKDTQYQYYIKLDTKTPYSKERQKERLMEIFQIERQYDTPIKTVTISDVLRNTDLENKEELLGRYNQLTNQDAQSKAQIIQQLIGVAGEFGVPEEMLNAALQEIISNAVDTPALDELRGMLEQGFQQQMNQMQQTEMGVGGDLQGILNAEQGMGQNPDIEALLAGLPQGGGLPAEMQTMGQPRQHQQVFEAGLRAPNPIDEFPGLSLNELGL